MEKLLIDRTKLSTQSAYAKQVKLTPARINQLIKEKKLKTVQIDGATLILKG